MPAEDAVAEAAYVRLLPDLQGWVGWFVVVRGNQLGGVFPTYSAAAHAWMSLYGPVPALIRRIDRLPAAAIASPATKAAGPSAATDGPTVETRMEVWCKWGVYGTPAAPDRHFAA